MKVIVYNFTMRLWSIHPQYLDRIGLIACWREALLAKKVLQGKTKGYAKHPQLIRFRNYPQPVLAINTYLYFLWLEADQRGYKFQKNKIGPVDRSTRLPVTFGQINYEISHLLKKLKKRKFLDYSQLRKTKKIIHTHPIFFQTNGKVELWEKRSS